MKIAHILQTSLDSGQGGIATYLRNVVPLQIEKGHDVSVVTNRRYEQFGEYSIPVNDFNFLKDKKFEALLHSLNANSQLMFSDFDVLHYHFSTSAAFSVLPALTGKKRVLTVHGRTEVARELRPITKSILKLVNNIVIPNMDSVTTVTPYLNEFIKQKYDKDNIYLPHGFSESENLEAKLIKDEFDLEKNSYYLALGRLTTSKGFDTIINAYKKMPSTSKKLVIAGPSEKKYFSKLKSIIPKKLKNDIIFTGDVKGDMLNELYSNSFLYIAALENMGLSLTVLEAMSHKTPILSSYVEGNNYNINEFVHKFKNKDSDDLSKVMFNLENNNSERLRFVDNAFDCAKLNHSWEDISNQFLSIYENLK